VQKKETLGDKLDESERLLHQMEHDLDPNNKQHLELKADGKQYARHNEEKDNDCASVSSDESVDSIEVKVAGSIRRSSAESMEPWQEHTQNDRIAQSKQEQGGDEHTMSSGSKKSEKEQAGRQGKRHYSISTLLTRKHPKIHM
jgi:hypothetical protein